MLIFIPKQIDCFNKLNIPNIIAVRKENLNIQCQNPAKICILCILFFESECSTLVTSDYTVVRYRFIGLSVTGALLIAAYKLGNIVVYKVTFQLL